MGSVRNFPATKVQVCRCGSSADHLIFPTDSEGSRQMYSSSALETRGCSSGFRYSKSQNTSQTNPSAPVSRKAERQPQCSAIHGTTSGVMMAPAFVPALKIPVASARSFLGNHSATHLMLAGKTPASPNPKAKRAAIKVESEKANAWPIEAKLQKAMASA